MALMALPKLLRQEDAPWFILSGKMDLFAAFMMARLTDPKTRVTGCLSFNSIGKREGGGDRSLADTPTPGVRSFFFRTQHIFM